MANGNGYILEVCCYKSTYTLDFVTSPSIFLGHLNEAGKAAKGSSARGSPTNLGTAVDVARGAGLS